MKFTCFLSLLFLSINGIAQNVGINVINEPSAVLHLQSTINEKVHTNDGFEDGMISPPFNGGYLLNLDEDQTNWTLTQEKAYTGLYSIACPQAISEESPQYFNFPGQIPIEKMVKIRFSIYKGEDFPDAGVFRIGFNNEQPALSYFEISLKTLAVEQWELFETEIYSSGNNSGIVMGIDQLEGDNLFLFVDDIRIDYTDNHSLRIEDGTEAEGALLMSDELGNVHWENDFSSFLKDSSVWNELQQLSITDDSLKISQGNALSMSAFDNQNLSFDTSANLSISGANAVQIDRIGPSSNQLLTVGNKSNVTWGENNIASSNNSTAIGMNSLANGIGSLASGYFTEAYSLNEIALGRYNYSSPFGDSAVWNLGEQVFSVGIGTASQRRNAISILKNGRVGIGVNFPNHALAMEGSGDTKISILSTGGESGIILNGFNTENLIEWWNGTSPRASIGYDGVNDRLICYQQNPVWYAVDGNMGIKKELPIYALDLPNDTDIKIGKARANAWVVYSDMRIKKNGQELTYGMNDIMKLKPKSYDQYDSSFEDGQLQLKESFTHNIGLYAQEVYEIIPEAVNKPTNEQEDLWSMDYEKLIPVLIKAMQEQQQKIEYLEGVIEDIQNSSVDATDNKD